MLENSGNLGPLSQERSPAHSKPVANVVASIPLVAIVAVIINGLIFTALPLLRKIDGPKEPPRPLEGAYLTYRLPEKPPEPPEAIKKRPPKPLPPPEEQQSEMPKPEIDLSGLNLDIGRNFANTLQVSLGPGRIEIAPVPIGSVYSLDDVDKRPLLTRHYPPLYPFAAKRKAIEGEVIVRLVVDKTGRVQDPEIIEAVPEGIFEASALRAVRRWRFRPATKGGEKVDVYVVVPVKFELAR